MEQTSIISDAADAQKDARIKLKKEECALSTVQHTQKSYAANPRATTPL
jgi:hypothetical protein